MLSNSALHFIWLFLAVSSLPHAAAMPEHSPFPDITFKAFSGFITTNFSSKISLATVLLLLFTMTENPELLSLHARQQNREISGEKNTTLSAWIKSLSRSLVDRIGEKSTKTLFKSGEIRNNDVDMVATKLDALAKLLDLTPYKDGRKRNNGKLKPISHQEIQPVLAICPNSVNCEDMDCEARGLLQSTDIRDIPLVTLIKGTTVHKDVIVLGGKCPKCKNTYQADHDRMVKNDRDPTRVYVNSAKYLKVGQKTWVDRSFAGAVLNGIYSFHASASAYTEFWNSSYSTVNGETVAKITRRQVWQAFIQESIRMVAAKSKINLEMRDGLSISDKTKQAFAKLGNQGIIPLAKGHACKECSQPYREPSDVPSNIDAAAVVGMDERRNVPPLIEEEENSEDGMMAVDEENIPIPATINQALQNPPDNHQNSMDVDITTGAIPDTAPDVRPKRDVTMDVLDGLVMGPLCCAADNCNAELQNHRGGAFCAHHEALHGSKCRMRDCPNAKVSPTQACEEHQSQWRAHVRAHSRANLSGIKRMLQRPGESLPWQTAARGTGVQAHDEEAQPKKDRSHFFSPSRFYCVETICKPCGVVVAWTKFAKAESETNILKFLETVYPTEESRPQYICIDKACKVLRTSISNGSWLSWSKTTRFVVDSYHYINH